MADRLYFAPGAVEVHRRRTGARMVLLRLAAVVLITAASAGGYLLGLHFGWLWT